MACYTYDDGGNRTGTGSGTWSGTWPAGSPDCSAPTSTAAQTYDEAGELVDAYVYAEGSLAPSMVLHVDDTVTGLVLFGVRGWSHVRGATGAQGGA